MIKALLYFLIILKATLFSSGGFSNYPSIHQDMLASNWASESDFGESVGIGQLSPGPNGLWVISLGYLSYGLPGAALALLAITLPPFLVLGIAAIYTRIEHVRQVKGAMRGVSLAVIALTITVCWTILAPGGLDWRTAAITVAAFALGLTKKVNILLILALATGAGFLLFR